MSIDTPTDTADTRRQPANLTVSERRTMSNLHWIAIAMTPGIGGTTLRLLVQKFGSAEAVVGADIAALTQVPRVTQTVAESLRNIDVAAVQEGIDSLQQEGIAVVVPEDKDWPKLLCSATDAPPILFVKGSVLEADSAAVAIVGTREPTDRGLRTAEAAGKELAARGLTVVGGLAIGIDTAAHRGALQAPRGRTIAVLGSGIRVVHPQQNRRLAEEIVTRGALLSELRPDAPPGGPQLMARDRIIAALARAVIVVEAQAKSGSLDTARRAGKQGRLTFAFAGSPGADELIKSGVERLEAGRVDFDALARRIAIHEPARLGDCQRTFWYVG